MSETSEPQPNADESGASPGAVTNAEAVRSVFRKLDDWLRPYSTAVEKSPTAHLVALCAAIFGAYHLFIDLQDRREQREELRQSMASMSEERVERAWTRLLTPAGGNTGKGAALDVLFKERQSIDGVNLSCEAVGTWDAVGKTCRHRPIFASFVRYHNDEEMEGAGKYGWGSGWTRDQSRRRGSANDPVFSQFEYLFANGGLRIAVPFAAASFAETVFTDMIWPGNIFNAEQFRDVEISFSDIRSATWQGDDLRAEISYADVSHSVFSTRSGTLEISESNVTGVLISAEMAEALSGNWAWADRPPFSYEDGRFSPLKPEILRRIELCDNRYRVVDHERLSPPNDLTDQGYAADEFVHGSSPLTIEVDDADGKEKVFAGCQPISIEEARQRFPDRYPPNG